MITLSVAYQSPRGLNLQPLLLHEHTPSSQELIIESCRSLFGNYGLTLKDIIVCGSAAIDMQGGLSEGDAPSDVDLLVTNPDKFDLIQDFYDAETSVMNKYSGPTIKITASETCPLDIDMTKEWPTDTPLEEIQEHAQTINGIQVMALSDCLSALREFKRAKDTSRIERIHTLLGAQQSYTSLNIH